MAQNDLYDLTTMLDEARLKLDRQFKSTAVFRDHAKTIFGASSVIVSLFAALKITSVPPEKIGICVTLWILIAICYIGLTFSGIKTRLLMRIKELQVQKLAKPTKLFHAA